MRGVFHTWTVKSCVLDKIKYKLELEFLFICIMFQFLMKFIYLSKSTQLQDYGPWTYSKTVSQSSFQHVEVCWNVTPTAVFSCQAVICCVTVMALLDEITTIILLCFFSPLFFFLTLIRKTAISFDSYKEFNLCGDTMHAQTINISQALPPILLIYRKWS